MGRINRLTTGAPDWREPDKAMPPGHDACGSAPGSAPLVQPTREAEGLLDYRLRFNEQEARHLQVQAGAVGTWAFRFLAGEQPIVPGGSIRIYREANNMVLARAMQDRDPQVEHYTTLRRAGQHGGARFRHFAGRGKGYNLSLKDNVLAVIEITDVPFAGSDDGIVLTVGDTSGGALPADVPSFAMFNCRYWIDVDFTGRGLYHRLSPPIIIDVMPGAAARLRVVAPSVVRPSETFRVRASAEDLSSNPWAACTGDVTLSLPDGTTLTASLGRDDWGFASFDGVSLAEEGVCRLEVAAADGALQGVSNPVRCSQSDPRVVWGDTHCHTYANDGHGSIEHNFRFARDVAFLDFFSLADHTHSVAYCEGEGNLLPVEPLPLDQIVMRESAIVYWSPFYVTFDEHWAESQMWARRLGRDGEFVPFLGYEWQPLDEDMAGDAAHKRGDWCVLYRDTRAEGYRPLKLDQLLSHLDPDAVIATPHHGGRRDSLTGFEHNPAVVPSVEVASMHNRAEHLGQKALGLGWKAGFHGASDGHMGRPGYDVWPPKGGGGGTFHRRHHGERSAITGVVVDELARDDIWRNWLSRRHYATTGQRILLSVHCGATCMGGEVTTHEAPEFGVRVHGTAPIARVDILRGDRLAHTERPGELDPEFHWTDPDPQPGETPYYVRVTQHDDALAWSSPVYVTFTGEASATPRELPPWHEVVWPEEEDAQHDPELEARALELVSRRCKTMDSFEDLRAVGLYQDHRGKYVLLRARHDGRPAQWKVYYEFPDWRISGKPGRWNTCG